MRRPGGYAVIENGRGTEAKFDKSGKLLLLSDKHEIDTFACVHCNSQVHAPVQAKDTDYFFCRNCMARICPTCADYPCIPFLKKIEAQEDRDYRLRCIGI